MRKHVMSVAVGILLVSSGAAPMASVTASGADVGAEATRRDEPSAKVAASSGRNPIEMRIRQDGGDVETVVGSFDARLSSRGRIDSGWIHMKWGDVRGARNSGVEVVVEVVRVSVVSTNRVDFEGRGVRTDRATGAVSEFSVSGSANRAATAPDCVIFDIIGGSVHDARVELPGRFDVKL